MPGRDLTAARMRGVDAEAAGERDLDLAARQIEHDGDPAAAAGLARR